MEDKKLDELEEHIEEVRHDPDVDEAVNGSFHDPDVRFYESGEEEPEKDDQTIAPPG